MREAISRASNLAFSTSVMLPFSAMALIFRIGAKRKGNVGGEQRRFLLGLLRAHRLAVHRQIGIAVLGPDLLAP